MIPTGVIAQGGAVAPNPPTSFTASPTSNSVSLSWVAPSFNGGAPISSYTLSRTGVPTPIYVGEGTSFSDTGLSFATGYSYTLFATNAVGNSTTVSVSTTTLAGVPGTPTLAIVSVLTEIDDPGDPYEYNETYKKTYTLSTTIPSNNGSALTGLLIESSSDSVNWSTNRLIEPYPPLAPEQGYPTVAPFGDFVVYETGPTAYFVRGRAVNAAGTGAASNVLYLSY